VTHPALSLRDRRGDDQPHHQLHAHARTRRLLGEGRLMKLGRALAVGDFTIWSEGEQEPVAHATLTYSLPRTTKKG
jgi:acyl-coenzyme A thioesterase PaaI-like protein